jgi:hypothetical protein
MATDQLTKIPPLYAVRTALGLSIQDAAIILNDSEAEVLRLDDGPSDELALLAEMIGDLTDKGEVILKLTEKDGSTFKEWKVTRDGFLEEVDRGN